MVARENLTRRVRPDLLSKMREIAKNDGRNF